MYCRFARIRSERLQKSVVRITGKTTNLLGGMVMSAEGNKKSAESSKKPRGKRSRVEEPPTPASILSHHPEGDGYK